MKNNLEAVSKIREENTAVEMGNGNTFNILKIDAQTATTEMNNDVRTVTISDVTYIPELTASFLSVICSCKKSL